MFYIIFASVAQKRFRIDTKKLKHSENDRNVLPSYVGPIQNLSEGVFYGALIKATLQQKYKE